MARTASRKRTRTKKTKPGGRPSKCTPAVTQAIAGHVRRGMPRERAAIRAGVSPTTFYRWMQDGEMQTRGPYREFREAVQGAEAELLERLVGAVVDTALDANTPADPGTRLRAQTYMLSNRFPGEFTTRQEVRHEGKDGGAIQVSADVKVAPIITADVAAGLDPEQLAALAREMMSKG
jgi:hypothetical protein